MKKKCVLIAVDEDFRAYMKELSALRKRSIIDLSKDIAEKNRYERRKNEKDKDIFW